MMKTNFCDAETPMKPKQKCFSIKKSKNETLRDALKFWTSHLLALCLPSFQRVCDAETLYIVLLSNYLYIHTYTPMGRASRRIWRLTCYFLPWRKRSRVKYG